MLNRVSAFFDYFSRLSLPQGRVHLPEMQLPGAKNAALIGLAFFIAFKLYRSYQSLLDRVHELATENAELKNKIEATNPKKNESQHESSANAIISDIDEEDLYQSAEEDHAPESLPSTATLPPLELFKNTFPGRHIEFWHQNSQQTLSDYLQNTLFRIDTIASCTFDQSTTTFSLTYSSPITFAATKLPQTLWDQMSWTAQLAVSTCLKMAPNIRISEEIKVQFVKTTEGVEIRINSIFCESQPFSLESIFIPNPLQRKLVRIRVGHTSNPFNMTIPIGPQLLAEAIDLNFPSQ